MENRCSPLVVITDTHRYAIHGAELTSSSDAFVSEASWYEETSDHEQQDDDGQRCHHDDQSSAPRAR